jgi:catechol 2,3-dioxygenase-like lactoylglutathione lyase family enzyme
MTTTATRALTYGLSHVDIAVRDPESSCAFYAAVFDMEIWSRKDDGNIVVRTPGTRDLIQFTRDAERAATGGLIHLGFCLRRAKDVDAIVDRTKTAGGEILIHRDAQTERPYAKVRDPDGYEIEVYKL